jgi:hypothetical protein
VSITLTFSFTACAGSATCQPLLFFIALGLEIRPTSQRTTRRALVASFSVSVQHCQTEMIVTAAWCAVRFLAGPICGASSYSGA